VFLLAAARRLAANGAPPEATGGLLYGIDLHETSLSQSRELLSAEDSTQACSVVTSSPSRRRRSSPGRCRGWTP